jgi:hypothetical protein
MKQRIALVAVSALTAGLFSVVSTPAANAAAGGTTDLSIWVSTTNSVTGVPLTTADGGDVVATTDRSVGWVALTSAAVADRQAIQGGGTGLLLGQTGTGVALSTAQLRFNVDGGTGNKSALTVTGGTISGATAKAAAVVTYNSSNTAIAGQVAVGDFISAVVTPNAGVTTMTVRGYSGPTAMTAADVSTGTLLGTWSITIASAAATGTFSPSLSLVGLGVSTAAQITASVDASTGSTGAGNPYYIQVIGKNAYNEALAAGTYVATATNGALLNWGDSAAAATITAGTLSVATKTPDGTDQLRIDPASSLTTSSTTVTITHDGLPVATKTMTFYGEAKKIVIEKVVPGTVGTTVSSANSATAYAVYSYRDSADGKVPGGAANFVATAANATITNGTSVRSPSRSIQAAITSNMSDAVETLIGTGADGVFAFTCGSTPNKADATITHTNAITGAALTATVTGIGCYGPIATYTVSTDKAKYAVGEIATITIEGKDAAGNPVSDAQLLGANTISVGGGSLTTGNVAATDVFTAGKATYKAQMTTAGTFNTVVSIAGSTTTAATATYSISDGNVSNAEVLKSIVALIASINKQIAALQKLILRR